MSGIELPVVGLLKANLVISWHMLKCGINNDNLIISRDFSPPFSVLSYLSYL